MAHKLPLWHIDIDIPGVRPDIDPPTGGAAGVLPYGDFALYAPAFIVNFGVRHISAYDDSAATGAHAQASAQSARLHQYPSLAFALVFCTTRCPFLSALINEALPGPTVIKEVERSIPQQHRQPPEQPGSTIAFAGKIREVISARSGHCINLLEK